MTTQELSEIYSTRDYMIMFELVWYIDRKIYTSLNFGYIKTEFLSVRRFKDV